MTGYVKSQSSLKSWPKVSVAADILKKEQRIAEIMGNIRNLLATK